MKAFSKLHTDFWTHHDNLELIKLGLQAQLIALYLQSNSHHNMLGVYYLPLLYVASDLRLSVKQVQAVLNKLCRIGYCQYDKKNQYVWVCNLGLEQIGERIDIKDNRIKAIHSIWGSLPNDLVFLEEIYNKYHLSFKLEARVFDSATNYEKDISHKKNGLSRSGKINKARIGKASIEVEDKLSISIDDKMTHIAGKNSKSDCHPIRSHEGVMQPSLSSSEISNIDGSSNICLKGAAATPSKTVYNFFDLAHLKAYSDSYSINSTFLDAKCNSKDNSYACTAVGINIDSYTKPGGCLVAPVADAIECLTPSIKGLQNPFETPLEPLPSNIEYINKNKEVRIKNTDNRRKTDKHNKTTKYSNSSYVLNSNIVAPVRPRIFCFSGKPEKYSNLVSTDPIAVSNLEMSDIATKKSSAVSENTGCKNNASSPVKKHTMEVFEHWKNVMQHPKSKLDRQRDGLIRKALQLGYSSQDLCDAITGCSYTPHNIGLNDRGQRYDGLHVILRDADQIDRFVHNFHHPPKPVTAAHQRLRANLNEAGEWLKRKNNTDSNESANP